MAWARERSGLKSAGGSDLPHTRAQLLRSQRQINEWASAEVAQQPRAGNGRGGIQRELVVLELGDKRLELLGRGDDTCLRTNRAALVQTAGAAPPPENLEPLGLVVLAERLRPEARETVEYFRSEGVQLKIISGDAPETVAAIAADLGIGAGRSPVDGRQLPDDEQELARQVLAAAVVGRISPEGKRRVIVALRAAGCHTAMVGDGVNDVPALKAAHLAIAQGTG